MVLSYRVQKIAPSPTLSITEKAAKLRVEGHAVLGLSAGEPDFDTPDFIKEAAKAALDAGHTKYTPVDGIPALKDAIIETLKTTQNLSYKSDEVIVSSGAKQAIYNALCATINPGDEVIIPAPCWVSYESMITLMEGQSVVVPCEKATQFKLSPDLLESAITPKTKWLILNAPSNPTGAVYTKAELWHLQTSLKDILMCISYPMIFTSISFMPLQLFIPWLWWILI